MENPRYISHSQFAFYLVYFISMLSLGLLAIETVKDEKFWIMNSGLMLIEILFFYLWLDSDAGVYLKFLEKNKYKSFEILDSNNKPSKKFPMWIYLIINFLYIISIWNFGSAYKPFSKSNDLMTFL